MQGYLIPNIGGSALSTPLATAIALLLILVAYFVFQKKNHPPGPIGLPYFGYWPFIRNADFHLQLEALKKTYGDVFSFTCTGQLYINLGSLKAVREACITKFECFGDRPASYTIMYRLFKDGVLSINGESWKVARKYFLAVLKERSVNSLKSNVSGPLYDSIKSTVIDIKAKKGEPLNLIELLMHECCAILRLTMFGEEEVTQEQVRKFNELYTKEITSLTPRSILLAGKFAKYFIFPFMPNFLEALKCHKKIENLVQGIINEHKATYDSEIARDIIDEYFQEREKRRSRGDSTAEHFTDKVLLGSVIQFMGDGALITASFTSLLMNGLLQFPEEQEKLYMEITEVVGLDRQPTIEDKSKLTYFNAYIKESIRTAEFLNFFPTQECTRETTVGGYRIPKGAILLQNFYSCHHDPEVYDEPEKFNPSRYIPEEGKRKAEPPIMFGVGKRSCLGEGFVMMQAFLLLATLVQNFHLSLPEGTKITIDSFVNSDLLICAKPRQKYWCLD